MNKSLFKKCLQILDKLEIVSYTIDSFYKSFIEEASHEGFHIEQEDLNSLVHLLENSNNIIHFEDHFDLSESLYIFARSRHNSTIEALSLFEALIQNNSLLNRFECHFYDSIYLDKLDSFFVSIIEDTQLMENINGNYYFNHLLRRDLRWIMDDIKKGLNCSDCLKVYYTKHLFEHTKLLFRNEDAGFVSYDHLDLMMTVYDKVGIPEDRDSSKELQVFFKDCLFNEFRHSCCVCGIDLPYMLIASHIKPFRDCGYLVEAMDANNGLLLCRNHDYLFDQGYISFDDNGELLISPEVLKKKDAFNIHEHFKLNNVHMTKSRKKFLEYHRKNYFQKKKDE
ncbi:MAG: HNH endonuclease [Traorella sp.]